MQEIGRPMTVPTKRQNLQMGCQHEQAVNTIIAIAMLLFPAIITRQHGNADSDGIHTAGPACFNSPLPPDTQFEAIHRILGTSMNEMIQHLEETRPLGEPQLHIGK